MKEKEKRMRKEAEAVGWWRLERDEEGGRETASGKGKIWREERETERAFSQGVTPAVSVADEICRKGEGALTVS